MAATALAAWAARVGRVRRAYARAKSPHPKLAHGVAEMRYQGVRWKHIAVQKFPLPAIRALGAGCKQQMRGRMRRGAFTAWRGLRAGHEQQLRDAAERVAAARHRALRLHSCLLQQWSAHAKV